jgi:HSP20 family molecular chaperone IbpA
MTAKRKQRKEAPDVTAPPTGVSESGRSICIIMHLHGIPEEEVRIDLENARLIVSAAKPDGLFLQKITVPAGSRISRKKFRDGILELILERPL